ncbi:glycoside hydrolase family 3 protein [Paenibacillus anaericanus]|uniref:beta-N-acetylhexosaminidase n=1 Tax=Paenibacillus anaericanus TaxID=170367 RepID=A0A3S1CAJ7_9BACL|nr:glycoside hydrolase family 3 protein [Paenibacillus anaericanus]RUT47570.1 glycoside hydrolase family 3 protein [Paenibacillus anaericanus]
MKRRQIALLVFVAVSTIVVIVYSLNSNASKESIEHNAKEIVAKMTDKEKIGQLVMYTPTNETDPFSKSMIKEYFVGSALLNRRYETAVETAKFINQLQQWASESRLGIPIFISGDMEYGVAQRVPGEATVLPRQMAIGATQNVEYAERAAKLTAIEAKAMGFHWSFSPVADVNSNPLNAVIGVRSFGEDTNLVSEMTAAEIKGYQSEGIASSAKHFPGHGDTGFDTHFTLSTISYSEEVLREVHLPPFKAAIDQGIESIMTSHIIIQAIDPDLPATLSKKVLTGLLRNDLDFQGIIVTDAMVMEAISKNWGAGEAAVMAINAGADIVMANGSASDQLDTLNSLFQALQAGKLERSRIDESVERIITYKLKMNMFEHRLVDIDNATEVVGNKEHKELAERIAMDSVTLVKNDNILPFDPQTEESTLVVSMAYADQIAETVRKVSKGKVISFQVARAKGEKLDVTQDSINTVINLAQSMDRIMIFTYSDREITQGQIDLVNKLSDIGKPVVAVSLGNPNDIVGYPDVAAYMATYALDTWYWLTPVPVSWESAVRVIFGSEPKGKLPVTIDGNYPQGFGLSYP